MNSQLQPSGFFVLRTPLLPFEEFLRWTNDPDPRNRLPELLDRPEVLEALFLASPSLVGAISHAESSHSSKALQGLASYFTRMCTRVVPFGLFAGLSLGRLGSKTRLDIPDRSEYRRHSRLDMGYLSKLVAALEKDPEVRRLVTWTPNSSLYRAGGRLHFCAFKVEGEQRFYNLVAVDETGALNAMIDLARDGATVGALTEALVRKGASREDAEDYVSRLIDTQILVSELEPNVTGSEPIDSLIAALRIHPYTAGTARRLDDARTALGVMDEKGLGLAPADYRAIRMLLDGLPVKEDPAHLFQVDMFKPTATVCLGSGALEEIIRSVSILHRLASAPDADDPLSQFRDSFLERYEDREVSLVRALDPEIGIGFGIDRSHSRTPLLEGLDLAPAKTEVPAQFGPRDALLIRRLNEAIRAGDDAIKLSAAELDELALPHPRPLPDSFEVVATIAAGSSEAIDRGDFQLLIKGIAVPGASMLGRFCHGYPELHKEVCDSLRAEEALKPHAAFAEIVHLPLGRLGNILCRPVLRPFEIPFLGRSGASEEARLPLSDLFVAITGGKVVLRSDRLGREVIPRLSTAHNFSEESLGIYHFLCSLQRQGRTANLGWNWGPLYQAPFLPRVTNGRLVLARAQWNVMAADLSGLLALRAAGRIPRFVALVDGDNDLPTDLDNPVSVEALLRHTAGRHSVRLVELFPGPDELCSTGPEGRFTHDVILPLVRTPTSPAPEIRATARISIAQRRFAPGSEWFYAKLYTGTATADRVLVDLVGPMVDHAMQLGLANSWFFIRYSDPKWHVRLRLHGDAPAILRLFNEASAPFLEDERIWRIQLDTYEREMERYGGSDGMALSEQVFHHDSEAVLRLLQRFTGDSAQHARWQLALLGIDLLLSDLGFATAEKAAWTREMRQAHARDFRINGRLKSQIGNIYREQRQALSDLLEHGDHPEHPLASGVKILRIRSQGIRPLQPEMLERRLDLSDLAASYAHMHVIRLLRSAHRAQEFVVYNLLYRLYAARLARAFDT